MFDLPLNTLTYVNKHRVKERQLRYRYINEHSRQYKKYKRRVYERKRKHLDRKCKSSSKEDGFEDNEYLIHKRKKKRSKWTTLYKQDTQELEDVNNESESESEKKEEEEEEEEDNLSSENVRVKLEDDDTDFISSKDERKYFNDHAKPQHTYELWMDSKTTTIHNPLQTNLIKFPEWSRIEKRTKSKLKEPLAQTTQSLKAYQKLIPYGLYLYDPDNIRSHHKRPTIQDRHIETMIILLRFHISNLNWSIAYKIFALLIRIPRVDIRSIWQYGVAILNHNENPVQCLKFLEWMHSVFSSKKTYHWSTSLQSDPVFRGSSRNHTAQFSLTWLWNSLIFYSRRGHQFERDRYNDYERGNVEIKQEEGYDKALLDRYDKEGMEKLIERINEMILSPPFMEDGEVWFILAMCHMVRADYTSLCYLKGKKEGQLSYKREHLYNQVTQDISKVIKYLKECRARQNGDFLNPEDYIMRSLTQIEMRFSDDEEEEEEEEEEESTETSLISDDTDNSTYMPLPKKREEESYQTIPQATDEPRLPSEPESNSFQIEEENSFLQTLDMPDYLLEDDYINQYDNQDDNYYTNRDSDDREYSSD